MFLFNRSVGEWLEDNYDVPGTSVSFDYEQAEKYVAQGYLFLLRLGFELPVVD